MRLFYAQTEQRAVRVTAPYRTFPTDKFDEVLTVQPIKYLSRSGVKTSFKGINIKSIDYEYKNNGHKDIIVRFDPSFSAQTITFRVVFKTGFAQTVTLPYVSSTTVPKAIAAVEAKEVRLTRSTSNEDISINKILINSQLVDTQETTGTFEFDVKAFNLTKTSAFEVIGCAVRTTPETSKEFVRVSVTNAQSKFLDSSQFAEISDQSEFYYIFGQGIVDTFGSSDLGGCLDPNADAQTSGANYTINNCVYSNRSPENVLIRTNVGDLGHVKSVTYIEDRIPSASGEIDDVKDLTITYTDKSRSNVLPTSGTLDIQDDLGYLKIEWKGFTKFVGLNEYLQDDDKASISVSDSILSTDLDFDIVNFVSNTFGCLDNTAVNYDSLSTGCEPGVDCCLYCENAIDRTNTVINYAPSSADMPGEDFPLIFVINTNIIGSINQPQSTVDIEEYFSSVLASDISYNIYSIDQVDIQNPISQTQANITGSPLLSLANESTIDGVSNAFASPTPSEIESNNIVTGEQYIVETVIENIPSPCSGTIYTYAQFSTFYSGCTDPNADNYSSNPYNIGTGQCLFTDQPTVECEDTLLYSVTGPVENADGDYEFVISDLGLDSDGDGVQDGEFDFQLFDPTINQTYGGNTGVFDYSYTITVPAGQSAAVELRKTNGAAIECQVVILLEAPAPPPGIPGCTDPTAANFNPNATEDDGSCVYCSDIVFQLESTTNDTASCAGEPNNDGSATFVVENAPGNFVITVEDLTLDTNALTTGNVLAPGTYTAFITAVVGPGINCRKPLTLSISSNGAECGCTNPAAQNYNPNATVDDGSCIIPGCTDPLANNYNPQATIDNGSCNYSVEQDEPLCIPNTVGTQEYDRFLDNLKTCVIDNGSTLLFKIKGGIKCSTIDLTKLSLISYLLNRIGLECLYNCNYTFNTGDEAVNCQNLWEQGGPSGGSLEWVQGTEYISGDIVKYTTQSGDVEYYLPIGNIGGLATNIAPPNNPKWIQCENVTLPSGTETYLETFINFVQKFCTVCSVDPNVGLSQGGQTLPQGNLTQFLDGIDLENGDNLEL